MRTELSLTTVYQQTRQGPRGYWGTGLRVLIVFQGASPVTIRPASIRRCHWSPAVPTLSGLQNRGQLVEVNWKFAPSPSRHEVVLPGVCRSPYWPRAGHQELVHVGVDLSVPMLQLASRSSHLSVPRLGDRHSTLADSGIPPNRPEDNACAVVAAVEHPRKTGQSDALPTCISPTRLLSDVRRYGLLPATWQREPDVDCRVK